MPIPKVIPRENADGSFSSELTRSISHEALNEGRETIIPTIIEGVEYSVEEATRRAIDSNLLYPSFDTSELATAYAKSRSDSGGATAHGFIGKERQMPKDKKDPGYWERSKRRAAVLTSGSESKVKRGIAMLGSLVSEGIVSSGKEVPSREKIRGLHKKSKAANAAVRAAKKKAAMDRSEGVRREVEKAMPGDPVEQLRKIAEAAKKK